VVSQDATHRIEIRIHTTRFPGASLGMPVATTCYGLFLHVSLRPAARAPRLFIERRNRDVTERQAHDSRLVQVQPEETPGVLSSGTAGVERNLGVEAQEDRPSEGTGNCPVRSIKRSLQRRQ
jgi:hypothetical protein